MSQSESRTPTQHTKSDPDRWYVYTSYLLRNGHGKTTPRCWAGVQWGDTAHQCVEPATGNIGLCARHQGELAD